MWRHFASNTPWARLIVLAIVMGELSILLGFNITSFNWGFGLFASMLALIAAVYAVFHYTKPSDRPQGPEDTW